MTVMKQPPHDFVGRVTAFGRIGTSALKFPRVQPPVSWLRELRLRATKKLQATEAMEQHSAVKKNEPNMGGGDGCN